MHHGLNLVILQLYFLMTKQKYLISEKPKGCWMGTIVGGLGLCIVTNEISVIRQICLEYLSVVVYAQ